MSLDNFSKEQFKFQQKIINQILSKTVLLKFKLKKNSKNKKCKQSLYNNWRKRQWKRNLTKGWKVKVWARRNPKLKFFQTNDFPFVQKQCII